MQKKLEKSSFLNVKVEKIKWTLSCVTYVALKNSFYFCREVVLGEHVVGTDPDCDEKICAPKTIIRKVTKSIIHENWNTTGYLD